MLLWLLQTIAGADWEETEGFVIRASSESEARALAAAHTDGERVGNRWTDETQSTCVELTTTGSAEIILTDFNAG